MDYTAYVHFCLKNIQAESRFCSWFCPLCLAHSGQSVFVAWMLCGAVDLRVTPPLPLHSSCAALCPFNTGALRYTCAIFSTASWKAASPASLLLLGDLFHPINPDHTFFPLWKLLWYLLKSEFTACLSLCNSLPCGTHFHGHKRQTLLSYTCSGVAS